MGNGIKMPVYGDIDMNQFAKTYNLHGFNVYDGSDTKMEDLRTAFKVIIVSVLSDIVGDDFKRTEYQNGNATYEYNSKTFYIAIYIKELRVTYSVRTYTQNYKYINRSVYFDPEYMGYNIKSLLTHMLQDFHALIYLGANLHSAPEMNLDMYAVPTLIDISGDVSTPWYGYHEEAILTPRQYRKSEEAQRTLDKYFK